MKVTEVMKTNQQALQEDIDAVYEETGIDKDALAKLASVVANPQWIVYTDDDIEAEIARLRG